MLLRSKLLAVAIVATIMALAGWYALSVWYSAPNLPVALPEKPKVSAEWPTIDCAAAQGGLRQPCVVPAATTFLLKIKLKNTPSINPRDSGMFVEFKPLSGSADDKVRFYYGGAIFLSGRDESGVWNFEGVANVCTYREKQMRALVQLGGKTIVEVPVELESQPRS